MEKRKIAFDLDGVVFWFLIFLVPGAKKFLTELAADFELLAVTARWQWLTRVGYFCLKRMGLGFVRVVSEKNKAVALEGCHAFVDNKRSVLKEVRDAGVVEHLFWFRLGIGLFRKGLFGVSSVYRWRSLYCAIKAR